MAADVSTSTGYFDDEEAGIMGRDYKIIDADGHILEPVDLWDNYMDPQISRAGAAHVYGHRRQRSLEY